MDYRLIAETIVMPNGELSFSLKLFDLFGKLYFQRTSIYTTNAVVTISADAFKVEGIYNIGQDSFMITGSEFETLNANVDVNGLAPLGAKVLCVITSGLYCPLPNPDGDVEEAVRNLIAAKINQVNRNSPNMFLQSLLDFPEIENILPLLDQAITKLLQDDISATLNIALPSCGDIDRDGWIDLEVSN